MKAFITLITLVLFMSLSVNLQAETKKTQTLCPISGKEIDKAKYNDYQGRRIYHCCSKCVKKCFR